MNSLEENNNITKLTLTFNEDKLMANEVASKNIIKLRSVFGKTGMVYYFNPQKDKRGVYPNWQSNKISLFRRGCPIDLFCS